MGKGNKSFMGFDLKVVLMVSVALNVVLISRVLYKEDDEREIGGGVCLESGEAQVSRRRTGFDGDSSGTDVVDGGAVIDLDQ